jgi:hypothetical protein
MNRVLIALIGLSCLAASPALADEPVRPKEEGVRPYTPRAGEWELQVDGPAFPMWQSGDGYNTVRGVGVQVPTASGSKGSTVSAGVGGSLGYTVSDMWEIGGMLGFQVAAPSGSPTVVGFNIEPFLKLNFGAGMSPETRFNWFALVGVGLNVLAPGSGLPSRTLVTPELAGGVEMMLTHSFGVTVYIPVTASFNTSPPAGGSSSPVIGLGLGSGLVGYFDINLK